MNVRKDAQVGADFGLASRKKRDIMHLMASASSNVLQATRKTFQPNFVISAKQVFVQKVSSLPTFFTLQLPDKSSLSSELAIVINAFSLHFSIIIEPFSFPS